MLDAHRKRVLERITLTAFSIGVVAGLIVYWKWIFSVWWVPIVNGLAIGAVAAIAVYVVGRIAIKLLRK